jgi:phosphoribosylglycinamide formyltransferase-1
LPNFAALFIANNMKKRIALFISGRGSNMEAILKACYTGILQDIAEPVLVFSNRADAKGLLVAQAMGVETQVIESKGLKRPAFDAKVLDLLQTYQPNFIVLAGYMRILSPLLVQAYPQRIINIHPADTTQHQGLHGYEWAFDNKLASTKITVHYVDEGLDTGNIIAQKTVDLSGTNTLEEVEQRGLTAEHEFYSSVLKTILEA